jgi:predicted metal-dependent hydrolase
MPVRTKEYRTIRYLDQEIPVQIFREWRLNASARISKGQAILRLPAMLPDGETERHWQWFVSWVQQQLDKNKQLLEQMRITEYQHGQTLQVGPHTYTLHIEKHPGSGHSARLRGMEILLRLSSREQGAALRDSTRTLLSRVIANHQLPDITRRVLELNALHFRQNLNKIRLKYVQSRWGSCSSKGNINLSTRLLFAPPEVQDYVIIHELAHLIEFNHSQRFWQIVAAADPDYKKHEAWLKAHSRECEF